MASYICTQTRVLIVEADSAASARKTAEDVFYARPGFDIDLRKKMRSESVNVEKRRD